MQLTHSTDDGLASLLVHLDLESGILLGKLCQTHCHAVKVVLRLGLDSDTDHGLGKIHRLENNGGVSAAAQGVTRMHVLETDSRADVTTTDHLHGVLTVAVHLEQAGNALLVAGAHVIDLTAGIELTRIHAEEHQTAHIGVGSDLEHQCAQGLLKQGLACDLLLGVIHCHTLHLTCVRRAGQVGANGVE